MNWTVLQTHLKAKVQSKDRNRDRIENGLRKVDRMLKINQIWFDSGFHNLSSF